MNLQKLKEIIVSQREEILTQYKIGNIIEREVDINKLRTYLNAPNVLAILGIRRCGKSVLSYDIYKGQVFGYINFDDERIEIKGNELNKIVEAFYELYGNTDKIVLDEPQRIKGWELFVNRLRRTKKVIVTGSNSKLLSGELSSALTGRHIDFTLFPFSFREHIKYKNENNTNESFLRKNLDEYMKEGGFPERYKLGKEIVRHITFDIINRDIVTRYNIKKKAYLKEVITYLISNSAREFTFSKISNIFNVKDIHTIRNWISQLDNSYLGFSLFRYSKKLKEQLIAPRKFYTIDNGIINIIGFKASSEIGRLMENLVSIELFRRKSYWHNNWEIFYWKDHQQNEVDFVVKEGIEIKQLIQVTYANGRDEIEKREIKSLIKASNQFKCKNLLVITWDYEDKQEIENKNILYLPLWKWLINI